jgi:sigma-E factor negative regulatory protein RseA
MKQKISALMDGELFEDEAHGCLNGMKRDAGAVENWAVYHLIGDALRQPDHINADLSGGVHARLREEPTILAPRRSYVAQLQEKGLAVAAAATVAAIAVVTWTSLQISPDAAPQMVVQQAGFHPASVGAGKPDASEYLMAHQEFSPSANMSGGASYIRAVAYGRAN